MGINFNHPFKRRVNNIHYISAKRLKVSLWVRKTNFVSDLIICCPCSPVKSSFLVAGIFGRLISSMPYLVLVVMVAFLSLFSWAFGLILALFLARYNAISKNLIWFNPTIFVFNIQQNSPATFNVRLCNICII